jgi:acetyl esterase
MDPEIQQVLDAMLAVEGPPAHEVPIELARAAHEQETEKLSGPGQEVGEVRDFTVTGPGGEIPVRTYRPREDEGGVVAYFHGGGWAIGSIDSFDTVCRALGNASRATVVSVGYRLAPEHRFPGALEDCVAVTRWIADHAGAERLAVVGDSAGGNLAIGVARRLRDVVRFQALVYPVCDSALNTPSYREFRERYGLTAAGMQRYWSLYLEGDDGTHPDASPLRADDLQGLPPAYVLTAEFDVLRDEGEALVDKLRAGGVEVTHQRYDGTIHGFWRWQQAAEVARRAVAEVGEALRRELG